ncbi:MAG: ATP-binding cassette domain-containing protein [Candidatus Latescibacteria bacterium]|nr:ATP-binding cassette domain-containing protein [Candidatus Latescibacterota bacterium]
MDSEETALLHLDQEIVLQVGTRQIRVAADFAVRPGQLVFVLGATGTGKTVLARRLAAFPKACRTGLVRQEPASATDPHTPAQRQLAQAAQAWPAACGDLWERLDLAGLEAYPGRWSAGQQQRLLIGLQLARRVDLLIADEPTSALDPVNRLAVLRLLLQGLQCRLPRALVLATHDFLVIELARQLWSQMAGAGVPFPAVFYRLEADPNCAGGTVLRALPQVASQSRLWWPCQRYVAWLQGEEGQPLATTLAELGQRLPAANALRVLEERTDLEEAPKERPELVLDTAFFYGSPARSAGIDLRQRPVVLRSGQLAGLVGESGCGKTTLMKMAAGLLGRRWGMRRRRRPDWRRLQIVFQNPDTTTLNPANELDQLIAGLPGWALPGALARRDLLLQRLGLDAALLHRRPADLSGGEKYRTGLLLALLNEPDFLIVDEPFAAVDEETQERLVRLCVDLQKGQVKDGSLAYREGRPMGLLLISHQVETAFQVCDWWYALDRLEGRPYSQCVWDGRPVDAYQAYCSGQLNTKYMQSLMALSFADSQV